jgi:hypothetical protein
LRKNEFVTDSTGDKWKIIDIDRKNKRVTLKDDSSNDKIRISFSKFDDEMKRSRKYR